MTAALGSDHQAKYTNALHRYKDISLRYRSRPRESRYLRSISQCSALTKMFPQVFDKTLQ